MTQQTPEQIAERCLSGYSLDRGHAPVARTMLRDAIAAAITAERDRARPPEGCVRLPDGSEPSVCSDSTSHTGYRTIVLEPAAESARGGEA